MDLICSVKRVKNAYNRDFIKALRIYHEHVCDRIRTDENQIKAYVANNYGADKREMAFYVLYANKQVIGYAEVGILFSSSTFFVDYFILDTGYQNNAYFYTCYNLMIDDLKLQYPYFRYIIVEYYDSNSGNGAEVTFAKKCLSLEYYKIMDVQYYQPGLFEEGSDTIVPCSLLIQETGKSIDYDEFTLEKFRPMLYDIYINHYAEWYEHFFDETSYEKYKNNLLKLYDQIILKTGNKISLKGYTYVNCQYFNNSSCVFTRNSPFNRPKKTNGTSFVLLTILTIFIALGVAIGIYHLCGKILGIRNDVIAYITSLFVGIVSILGTFINIKISQR